MSDQIHAFGVFYSGDGSPGGLIAAFSLEEDATEWLEANPGFPKIVQPITLAWS